MNPRKNTISIAARFSAGADNYDKKAGVQQAVAEILDRMFPALPPPERYAKKDIPVATRILEIGCGTGLLTLLIRRRYPELWIDAVDVSARMIAQARTRLGFDKRIRWRVADLRNVPANCPYPLIVSSSSLHWICPLEEGLTKLAACLAANGCLVFSLMVRGTFGELRTSRLRVAPHKPPAGNLPTLQQVRRGLQYAGLTVLDERKEIRRVEYPSADAFLRQLHEQGLTGGAVSAAGVPLNRSELKELARDYQAHFRKGVGVKASYHVAYFKATKRI